MKWIATARLESNLKVSYFSRTERDDAAKLLRDAGDKLADETVHVIEKLLHGERRSKTPRARRQGLKLPRGRPFGPGIDALADTYILASVFQSATGMEIRNSKSHPFYRLAQVCLRRADPGALIASVKRPPWRLSKPGQFRILEEMDTPEWRAGARQFVRGVVAKALRDDLK